MACWCIAMQNSIQPQEYSRGGGRKVFMDGIPHNSSEPRRQPVHPVPQLRRRWAVGLELQLARQRLESPESVCGSRNSLHFSPSFLLGEFWLFRVWLRDFISCPFQPPIILPMIVTFSEMAMYCLSLSDPASQSTMRSILIVSTLRIARRTYGSLSSGAKKLAVAVASIASTNKLSTRSPSE